MSAYQTLNRAQWYALGCLASHAIEDDEEGVEVWTQAIRLLRDGDGEQACILMAKYYEKQLWPE